MSLITIRLWNDDSTDFIDFEGDTVEEIVAKAKDRIKLPTWKEGWSEVIKGSEHIRS